MRKKIEYLVMDVDGTLTDGKIYMGDAGEVLKKFDIKDGYAIREILPTYGIVPMILTGRVSKIVEKRCEELNIEKVYQGVTRKEIKIKSIIKDLSYVAYIGDDLNDIECMKTIRQSGGIIACPNDAAPEIVEIVHFVSSKSGGGGAVREFIEWIVC